MGFRLRYWQKWNEPSFHNYGLEGVAGRVRKLAAWTYGRLFLSAIPRVRGYFGLRFFSAIYGGLSVGPGARCWGGPSVFMERDSTITIGSNFSSTSDQRRAGIAIYSPCKLRTMEGASIELGDHVSLNGTSITSRTRVAIGSGTMVGANVVIVDSDFHVHWPPADRQSNPGRENDEPVTIGKNVWIGMGSLVLKGSTIGDNSIIGAGSVVTGSIPANAIATGAPAQVRRLLSIPLD